MRHRTLLRALLLVGLTFVVSGLTLGYYFSFAFDTRTSTVVSAPPGLDVPGDFAETVFYESDELLERAHVGTATGMKLLLLGLFITVPSAAMLAILGGAGRSRAAG